MTTLEILKAARELISVPERWTQGAAARHKNGNVIGWNTANASCWCSTGAVMKCGLHHADSALSLLAEVTSVGSVPYYNDTHTHAEVLAMFDRAISIAEAENE